MTEFFLFFVLIQANQADTLYLSLDKAISIALRNNPSIVIDRIEKTMSQREFISSLKSFLPSPSLTAEYSKSEVTQPLPGVPGGYISTTKGYSIYFNIQEQIFDPSLILSSYQARISNIRSGYLLKESEWVLELTVKELYYNLLKEKKLLKAKEKALESAEGNMKLIEEKFRLRDATELDLLRAREALASARLELLESKRTYREAERNLLNVVGIEEKKHLIVKDLEIDTTQSQLVELSELMKIAFKERPSLRGERDILSSYRANFWYNLLSFLPKVSLGWIWSHQSEDFPRELTPFEEKFDKTYSVYISLSFNFLDYPFDLMNSKDQLRKAEFSYRKARLDLIQSVENEYNSLRNAIDELRLASFRREIAREALRLSKTYYELGKITTIELFDVETQNLEAEVSYLNSLYNLQLARDRLNYAVGKEVIR